MSHLNLIQVGAKDFSSNILFYPIKFEMQHNITIRSVRSKMLLNAQDNENYWNGQRVWPDGAMRHPQIVATNQRAGLRGCDQSEAWIVLTQSGEIENMNNEYVNSIHYHQLHSQLHPPSNYPGPSSCSCVLDLSSSNANLVDPDSPSLLFSCFLTNSVIRILSNSLFWWLIVGPWPQLLGRQ